jgi:hypothetical protein
MSGNSAESILSVGYLCGQHQNIYAPMHPKVNSFISAEVIIAWFTTHEAGS